MKTYFYKECYTECKIKGIYDGAVNGGVLHGFLISEKVEYCIEKENG
ncbi:MAG: hypothetical protein PHE02_02150 [Lachnospiraceae bacterium]|nr:hypothetical protein [Lachnospiraceae bacterium]